MIISNNRIIYIFLLLLLLIVVNNSNADDEINYFIKGSGDFGTASNWNKSVVPTLNDGYLTLIGVKNLNGVWTSQAVTNYNGPANAFGLQIGSDITDGDTFITTYGVNTPEFNVVKGGLASFKITGNPFTNKASYYCDIGRFTNTGNISFTSNFQSNAYFVMEGSFQTVTSSNFSAEIIQNSESHSFYKDSTVTLKGLKGYDYSSHEFRNTNLLVLNNPAQGSSWFDNNTQIYFYDSKYISYDIFNIYNNSELFLVRSNASFYYDNDGSNYIGLQIKNSSIFVQDSQFFSSKYIGNYDSQIIFDNSTGNINNDFNLFDGSIIYGDASTITFTKILQLFNNSYLEVVSNSKVEILGAVSIWNKATVLINKSTFIINNLNPESTNYYFQIVNTAKLIAIGSQLSIECYLLAAHESIIYFESSTVKINSFAQISETSIIKTNKSSITLDENLKLFKNGSFLLLDDSSLTVLGHLSFFNSSYMVIRDSKVTISGYVYDYSLIYKQYFSTINNSNFNVNGFYITYGATNIKNNAILNVNNEFTIYGYLLVQSNSQISIKGSFINYGIVEMFDSKGFIQNGQLKLTDDSQLILNNSVITLNNGNLLLSSKANISLINSQINNQDGALTFNGVIYLNSNSNLKNSAHFILNNNIVPSESGSQTFDNSGTLDISDGNQTTTNILVPMTNAGTVNLGKNAFILSFTQTNGNLILSNGTLLSNNTILINNSGILGSGQIKGSITTNNGQLGNSSISNLAIDGSLDSFKDTFTFTIDSNSTSSFINISNIATINNSTVVIKINVDLLTNQQELNTTLIQSNNMNGNGFSKVVFKSYDPSKNTESDIDGCKHTLTYSKGTLGLLLNSNKDKECSTNNGGSTSNSNGGDGGDGDKSYFGGSLSAGAIAGIVVGCAAAVIIVGAIVHFRNRIPKVDRLSFKLKQYNA